MIRVAVALALFGALASAPVGLHQGSQSTKTPVQKQPNSPPSLGIICGPKFAVEVKYRWVQQDDDYEYFMCGAFCLGNHKKHEDCKGGSCDLSCRYTHSGTFEADVDDEDLPMGQLFPTASKIEASAKKIGLNGIAGIRIMRMADVEINIDTVADNYDLAVDWQHWSSEPCSKVERKFHWACMRLMADVTPKELDKGRVVFSGETVSFAITDLWIPTGVFEDGKPELDCFCQKDYFLPMPAPPIKLGKIGYDPIPIPIDNRDGKCTETRDGMEYVLTPQKIDEYKFEFTPKSMNEIEWSAVNPYSMPVDINIYPGVTLKSKDPSFQDIMATTALKLHLPAAMPGPNAAERVTGTSRGMCLNMLKEQPSGKTAYELAPPRSLEMVKLAKLYNSETIQTVEGQIRMWIASDHADLAEIQKHLIFPKPTPSQYLRSLYAADRVGGVDLSKPAYAKCLDPNLIGGAPANGKQIRWFIRLLEKKNPLGLAAAVKNTANFSTLWQPNASRYQDQFAADLANALAASNKPEVANAAASFLLTIPEANRASVAKLGGLSGIGGWLRRKDATSADAAIKVLEAFHSKESELDLMNVNAELPEATKTKAAEILKALG